MKCPSRFCGFENEDKANFCGKCDLDLKIDSRIVLVWDGLYASFLDTKDEMGYKFPKDISLLRFREMMKESPLLAFVLGMRGAMKWNKSNEEPYEKKEKISFSKKWFVFYFFEKIKETRPNKIIKFPKIFQSVCTNFKMTKEKAWDVLLMLNEFEIIELIPFNGVKLKF